MFSGGAFCSNMDFSPQKVDQEWQEARKTQQKQAINILPLSLGF